MLQTLVVDDSPVNRKVLRRLLLAAGCWRVAEATCGESACAAFLAAPTQLILMDLRMPNMDGWQATECIRRLERAHGLPPAVIVAVSTEDLSEGSPALQRCWECGMDAAMGKVVTKEGLDQLLQCVHDSLACGSGAAAPDAALRSPSARSSIDFESGCLQHILCSSC